MVFFAVAREGLETVFFLLAVFQQSEGPGAPIGALLGLMLAIVVGFLIYSGSMRLNLSRVLPLDRPVHSGGRRRHSRQLGAGAA